MSGTSKTSQQSAPPSIALAMMAWKLAMLRSYGIHWASITPTPRSEITEGAKASVEYYHILRRIEDGEAP